MPPRLSLFLVSLAVTLAFWVLRGLGILSFVPGLVLWILIVISVGFAILATTRPRRSS
jgi:hypothetical protein